MIDPELGRQAGHVFLDVANTALPGNTGELGELAAQRLGEIGCVTATFDDDTDTASVDATDLVGGGILVVTALVARVCAETGLDRDLVIAQTREVVDEMARNLEN